jgi:hypothetical protein
MASNELFRPAIRGERTIVASNSQRKPQRSVRPLHVGKLRKSLELMHLRRLHWPYFAGGEYTDAGKAMSTSLKYRQSIQPSIEFC